MFISIAFYAISLLAVIAIFLFKKRQNQFVVNRLNIILNLFLLGFFVYRSLNLSGETAVSEKGIGMLIPVFSIVFRVKPNILVVLVRKTPMETLGFLHFSFVKKTKKGIYLLVTIMLEVVKPLLKLMSVSV